MTRITNDQIDEQLRQLTMLTGLAYRRDYSLGQVQILALLPDGNRPVVIPAGPKGQVFRELLVYSRGVHDGVRGVLRPGAGVSHAEPREHARLLHALGRQRDPANPRRF